MISGPLSVDASGIVDLNGGTLTVNNTITNNGLFILSNGAQLAGVTAFTNNGTLDLITAGNFGPPNGSPLGSGLVSDSFSAPGVEVEYHFRSFGREEGEKCDWV